MERRGQERELGLPNSMTYGSPPVLHESPVKLPLAPILSTNSDRRGNPFVSPRRGTSIFSPSQTLDQPYNNPPPPAGRPHGESSPPPPAVVEREPSSDPDPPPSSTADASTLRDPPPTGSAATGGGTIKYRECLKNHAATMGGHVVDGCGEFMPSGDDGTPESFFCAACDCHRNFHRKDVAGEPHYHPGNTTAAAPPQIHGHITYSSIPPHHRHHHKHSRSHYQPAPPAATVNFGGAAAESSSEDLNIFHSGGSGRAVVQPSSKKRFRTKFSQDQKDRMQEFASKIGWRIQKQDEDEVQQFCNEVGVKRQVFKVWMHNNKQAMKKKHI